MVYPDRTPESLPNSCFDRSCLESFQRETGIAVPGALAGTPEIARWILANHSREWTEWKCGVIAGAVKALAGEARKIKPGIKINIHAVPWRSDDFGGAIRAVAGQDLARLAPLVDNISPMCYHHMVKQTPAWVHAVVEDAERRRPPSSRASRSRRPTFRDRNRRPNSSALVEALKPPSRGVVFWNWAALAESPEKLAAVKGSSSPAAELFAPPRPGVRPVLNSAVPRPGREVQPWPTSSRSSWRAARAAGFTL